MRGAFEGTAAAVVFAERRGAELGRTSRAFGAQVALPRARGAAGPFMLEHQIFRSQPALYATQQQHVANFAALSTQPASLHWSMVCPPVMIGAFLALC